MTFSLIFQLSFGGITISQDDCQWLTATDFDANVLKCDGNEVVVGACGGGSNRDCPDNSAHQLKCCAIPGYYYSDCDVFGEEYGISNDCRDHGETRLLEASCNSGANHDCHGFSTITECCTGHLEGKEVGPTAECTWEYSGHGSPLECGRSDEVVVGRCGSGRHLDCPGGTSHGILCCELDFVAIIN